MSGKSGYFSLNHVKSGYFRLGQVKTG